jgi:hypothetical protein
MTLKGLRFIVEDQFLDIVINILEPFSDKLRLILKDRGFIDIRISQKIKNRFDFHWERRHLDKIIYRYDNFPNTKFKNLKLFLTIFTKRKKIKLWNLRSEKDYLMLPLILWNLLEEQQKIILSGKISTLKKF